MKNNKLTESELLIQLKNISGKDVSKDVLAEIEFNSQYEATYFKGKEYKGYNVFVPEFKKNVTIGYPYVILAKDGEVRLSNEEESVEYLNF